MTDKARSKGLIFVLSAPSGGGKSTLAKNLLTLDSKLELSISATTRPPKPGEVEGRDYFFKTEEEFKKLIEEGELLEHATIYNHYYGTPKYYVEQMLQNGKDILFDIDPQGARSLKEKLGLNVVTVYILPPSLDILKERLIMRGREQTEEVELRLKSAKREMMNAKEYDYIVINDKFEQTLENLVIILKAERMRTFRLENIEYSL